MLCCPNHRVNEPIRLIYKEGGIYESCSISFTHIKRVHERIADLMWLAGPRSIVDSLGWQPTVYYVVYRALAQIPNRVAYKQ